MGKKDPFKFTIGFDKTDSDHVYVTELLNTTKKKSNLIVAAILVYMGKTEAADAGSNFIQSEQLRPLIQEIIREEVRKAVVLQDTSERTNEKIEELDLTEGEPLQMDQALLQDVTDAISAFRKQ